MAKFVDRFDDHWLAEQQRIRGCQYTLAASAKVVKDSGARRSRISAATQSLLDEYWAREVTPRTGFKTYDEMCDAVRQSNSRRLFSI